MLLCNLKNVLLEASFERPMALWREANGGRLGLAEPADLLDGAMQAFEVGAIHEDEFAAHLRSRLHWQGSDRAMVAIWDQAYGAIDPDVLEVLGELRCEGWHLTGTMNGNPWHDRALAGRYGEVLTVFHRVVTSAEVGLRLPDPRFYAAALREVPLAGQRLFVDVRPENVAGARGAGLDGHLFREAGGLRAACDGLAAPAL